jgi:hypothetical protein
MGQVMAHGGQLLMQQHQLYVTRGLAELLEWEKSLDKMMFHCDLHCAALEVRRLFYGCSG